jgi:hypothetical protein
MDDQARDEQTTGPRPRAGRDRVRVSPRRGARINPSFGPAEHARVVAAARRAGLTPTGYVALAALASADGEATAVPAPSAQYEALRDLQADLFDVRTAVNRIGTNLNQAVAALNATGNVPAWLEMVAARCAHSLAALDEVTSAIHRRIR